MSGKKKKYMEQFLLTKKYFFHQVFFKVFVHQEYS